MLPDLYIKNIRGTYDVGTNNATVYVVIASRKGDPDVNYTYADREVNSGYYTNLYNEMKTQYPDLNLP